MKICDACAIICWGSDTGHGGMFRALRFREGYLLPVVVIFQPIFKVSTIQIDLKIKIHTTQCN